MYYARGVADVTPEFIRGCGCDALLLDIDNTVSHVDAPEATAEAETWLQTLREAELPVGFRFQQRSRARGALRPALWGQVRLPRAKAAARRL